MLKAVLVLMAVAGGLLAALPAARTTNAGAPVANVTLSLDCDANTAGVQSACIALPGALFDVHVVMTNTGPSPVQLGAFIHKGLNPDVSRLLARPTDGVDLPPCGPSGLNCNPDFNQATVSGTWACDPPPPEPDVAATAEPGQDSFIGCFSGAADGPFMAPGASLVLSKIHYRVPAAAPGGTVSLTLAESELYDEDFTELGTCNPTVELPMMCSGATITLPQVSMSLDCNVMLPGVQSSCMVSNITATRDVNVVIRNSGASPIVVGAFGFKVQNPDITRLFAPTITGGCCFMNSNPDAAPTLETPGSGWACGPGGPFADDPGTTEPGQDSFISCFNGIGAGVTIAAGAIAHVATVHYNIVAGADPGPVQVAITEGGVYSSIFAELGTCVPVTGVFMPCNAATATMYCPIDMADVNNDNRVNVADMGITAFNNGVLPAPPHLDQNFDGIINVADRGIVGSHYFKSPSIHCP